MLPTLRDGNLCRPLLRKYHCHIAKWLGHSVQVMLEHYGRHKQSDNDQIAEACEQVKQRKAKMTSKASLFPSTPLPTNMGLTAKITDSTPQNKASLNASLYTAVRGGIRGSGAESPSPQELTQPLDMIALGGKNRQEMASSVNRLNYQSGGQGIRTLNRSPGN